MKKPNDSSRTIIIVLIVIIVIVVIAGVVAFLLKPAPPPPTPPPPTPLRSRAGESCSATSNCEAGLDCTENTCVCQVLDPDFTFETLGVDGFEFELTGHPNHWYSIVVRPGLEDSVAVPLQAFTVVYDDVVEAFSYDITGGLDPGQYTVFITTGSLLCGTTPVSVTDTISVGI